MANEGEDQILPLPSFTNYGSASYAYAQTYTAGEDSSRLAEMAKEFGLQQRKPRSQVRSRIRIPLRSLTSFYYERMLDPGFTDVRMRSIFSANAQRDIDEEGKRLCGRRPSWKEDDDGEELDPHLEGMGGDLVSATLGIIKGIVGPAILYLPHGFANAGYVAAISILTLATCLFLSSSVCLLDSWKLESLREAENMALLENGSKGKRTILSYPELAYRALGKKFEACVKLGIALMQSGVCLTYLIFVSQNLRMCTLFLFGYDLPATYFISIMLLFQIPLSWIRDIRKLTLTNLLANILLLYGLMTCLTLAFKNAVSSDVGRSALDEIGYKFSKLEPFNKGWFLFIGMSILLFEGSITLLIPIQESIHTDEDRKRLPSIYKKVILSIICVYTFFGIFCWMAFGNDVRTVMTTSLPKGALATSVQLSYSFAVVFTFPFQNFPALEIACRSIASSMEASFGKSTSFLQHRNIISSILVCILAVIAVLTMEELDKVVSLMGSLIGCPLALVFPPLIHSNLDPDLSPSRKLGNRLISLLGLCAMILASITTIWTW